MVFKRQTSRRPAVAYFTLNPSPAVMGLGLSGYERDQDSMLIRSGAIGSSAADIPLLLGASVRLSSTLP